MRVLDKPDESAEDLFVACVSIVRNVALRTRLSACRNLINEASEEFEDAMLNTTLHTIAHEDVINGNVTAKELTDVYTIRMVPKETPGRALYEKLLFAPAHGICPLCGHRTATTLDHHLPKAEYPRLSVTPTNLIPSCKDCNTSKLHNYPASADQETIHPYYDDIQGDSWLFGEVVKSNPPAIRFKVIPPDHWDVVLGERVKFHFSILSLNKLYSSNAATELVQINYHLKKIHVANGAIGVGNYLLNIAESRIQAERNSWQAALYATIARSAWYCEEGLQLQV